jgi:DNA-binding PadR family transcriptional regulator
MRSFDDMRGRGPRFGRGPWGHNHGRGRGRARRGDVRAAALALLAERPMHGYEMIQELASRTNGIWRPSPGSIYPALQMLEDEGLIRSQHEGGKRLFELTDAGRAENEARGEGLSPWEQVAQDADPSVYNLWSAIRQIVVATKQVADAGTPEQQAAAEALLTEVRRKLYLILADA